MKDAGIATAAISALPYSLTGCRRAGTGKIMLMRYDTEWWGEPSEMKGFFEKLVEVHRKDQIPVTLFCQGATLASMESEFRAFHQEVKGDPLFDLQDHSYSHVGIGYESGKPVEVLREDYQKSFLIHERILGKKPIGIARCGTRDDGPPLTGFDATEKSMKEFEMLAGMGMRMVDSFLTGIDGTRNFINYGVLGYPEVMGFISGFSDTEWMAGRVSGDPVEFMLGEIRLRAEQCEHMPVMFHDWVAWQRAPDQELTHVRMIAEEGKKAGYELATHVECYENIKCWKEPA